MDAAGYTLIARQSGLAAEMRAIANNIANADTTGFRREGVVFAEHVRRVAGGEPSLSIAAAEARTISPVQGALATTGGPLDLAIEGEGFFLVATPAGERLTRAGAFALSAAGDLVTQDGHPVLDAGGAPLFVPPGTADLAVAADGTVSAAGRFLGQVGVVVPADPQGLAREAGTLFASEGGTLPAEDAQVRQGMLERANVAPIAELTRMIEVQRAYELGQSLADRDHERQRAALETLGRR